MSDSMKGQCRFNRIIDSTGTVHTYTCDEVREKKETWYRDWQIHNPWPIKNCSDKREILMKHEIEKPLQRCFCFAKNRKLTPLKEWGVHHRSPTSMEIRRIIFSKENDCHFFVVRKDDQILIDEDKLFAFLSPAVIEKFGIGKPTWKDS